MATPKPPAMQSDQDDVRRALIPGGLDGVRLDRALAIMFPDFSRTLLKGLIEAGGVRLNDALARPRARVHAGDSVHLRVPSQTKSEWEAQPATLPIVYEDRDIIVIDKPAGLVVHPGAGNPAGTLANALLHHAPELRQLPRAGIVHRLDKDTSGLLVVARSPRAHTRLISQLQKRRITREYEAVVQGVPTAGGTIDQPLGRHRRRRTHMAVVGDGRPAVTHYRVLRRFAAHAHLRVKLETGRTHQIRVHLAHIGHPLVGDPAYGGRVRLPPSASAELIKALRGFKRQALHATRLVLQHPADGRRMVWNSPLPADMRQLLRMLLSPASK